MLLITTPNKHEEITLLSKTAKALGWDVYNEGFRIPDHLLKQPGAVYGEQFFCEIVAEQMGWKLLSNSLDWLTKLPEEYTNRKIIFTKLAEARLLTEEKFIKPADDKCFPAKVYLSGKDLPITPVIDDAPTLISDVMKFTSEYRCFVKNKIVTTACCYLYQKIGMQEPAINKPEHYNNNNDVVIEFVNKLLQDSRVECADGTVIDVGRFKKDTYTVIESNPVWAAGIYGCEPVAVLDAIKAACIEA